MPAAKPSTDAITQEYEALLNEKSDEVARLIREHAEELQIERDQRAVLRDRNDRLEKALRTERDAHDQTKAELFDALLAAERMRGYLAALEDARPPRMVEEVRQSHGPERYKAPEYGKPAPAPFFSRGAR